MGCFDFAIVSDVHLYTNAGSGPGAGIPANFRKVIAQLVALAPRFVVVSGDSTGGNPNDGASRQKVDGWWRAFAEAIEPLRQAGIAVLGIAGNHDYYTKNQKEGFHAAWSHLGAAEEQMALAAMSVGSHSQCPRFYSVQVDDLHLALLHVVDQDLPTEVADFLRRDAEEETASSLRLCIGHVPLVSMMGRTSNSFRDELGSLLVDLGYSAYFAGHEHLVWEQSLEFPNGNLHHIHVGTASGTYHFPLNRKTYETHCQQNQGTLPYAGQRFLLEPGTRQQADKVNLCLVHVQDGTYSVSHLSLRDDTLQPFGIEA